MKTLNRHLTVGSFNVFKKKKDEKLRDYFTFLAFLRAGLLADAVSGVVFVAVLRFFGDAVVDAPFKGGFSAIFKSADVEGASQALEGLMVKK